MGIDDYAPSSPRYSDLSFRHLIKRPANVPNRDSKLLVIVLVSVTFSVQVSVKNIRSTVQEDIYCATISPCSTGSRYPRYMFSRRFFFSFKITKKEPYSLTYLTPSEHSAVP